ncbi:uncharacterized protein RCC_08046 [Ramularia collo-cygni]|uniref:Uncharacterized protein n=1 Tax=Ramularia collo-cygni TaxID=112498 RepID=A0A2D3VBJ2_9PEZI|nr:uncharacterized protein RCC_08046 [Ramularia collo-cygni]CZT22177.1 uncharacterized protein RCC_08046 [Ramularia collo-cygni]
MELDGPADRKARRCDWLWRHLSSTNVALSTVSPGGIKLVRKQMMFKSGHVFHACKRPWKRVAFFLCSQLSHSLKRSKRIHARQLDFFNSRSGARHVRIAKRLPRHHEVCEANKVMFRRAYALASTLSRINMPARTAERKCFPDWHSTPSYSRLRSAEEIVADA